MLTSQQKTALEMQALQDLLREPLAFLKRNAVTPANAGPGSVAGVNTYKIEVQDQTVQRPGTILGKLRTQDAHRFKINGSSVTGTPFQAVYIPVQPSNVAINPFPLSNVGTNFMITTQLTGCCVVMVPMGASWGVAHLQPTGETGMQLEARLKNLGMRVYGRNTYGGSRAALVGVRKGVGWDFYTQTQDAYFNVLSAGKLS